MRPSALKSPGAQPIGAIAGAIGSVGAGSSRNGVKRSSVTAVGVYVTTTSLVRVSTKHIESLRPCPVRSLMPMLDPTDEIHARILKYAGLTSRRLCIFCCW